MANALIVFTPRSGSTIVAELLAHKYNALNLDEFIHGDIRGTLDNKLPAGVREMVRNAPSLGEQPKPLILKKTPILSDLLDSRLEVVKNIAKDHEIVFKLFPSFVTPGINIIEWAIENNFELYFIHRKNKREQIYSYVLANCKAKLYEEAKKSGKLSMHRSAGFLNVRNATRVIFPPIKLSREEIIRYAALLCNINGCYNCISRKYKDYGKHLSYENTIAKKDYTAFGIDKKIVDSYAQQPESIRPTYDYEIGSEIVNWDEVVEVFNKFDVVADE